MHAHTAEPDAIAAFLHAFTAASTTSSTDELKPLLLAAVGACSGALELRTFVETLDQNLHQEDAEDPDQAKWWWLLAELQLMQELHADLFDERVAVVLQRLEMHLASRHTGVDVGSSVPTLAHEPRTDEPGNTAWDAMAYAMRDSSRYTLRRLVSGGSADSNANATTRDSFGSSDSVTTTAAGANRAASRSRRRNQVDDKGIPLLQSSSSTVSDAMPALLRSISSMIGMGMEETFLCQICYEHSPVADAIELSTCSHQYCEACFRMYVELKITEGQVYPVCFHETEMSRQSTEAAPEADGQQPHPQRKACGVAVAPSDIESLVSAEVWAKYLTFKFNKENECGRQCPYCHESQLCKGPEDPEISCVSCGKRVCFTHGNAHADESCADYELKQAEAEKLNRSAIAEISKPCPGCKNNVEKSGGCNHMKCIVCNTDFCWICGAVVDSALAPTHFQWWNLRGCAGQQMEDVDSQTPAERLQMAVFRVLFIVVLGPPALAITIVLTVLSCFCLPCMRGLNMGFVECFTTCLNYTAMALFMALLAVAMALAFIIGLLYEILIWPVVFVYFLCRRLCCPFSIPPPDDQEDHASPTETPAAPHAMVRRDTSFDENPV